MTADAAGDRREVIVVGGGQAGLAIGYLLAQQGRQFTILEAANTPAAAWRERWDSLRLFTPVRYDSLPGRAFPGHPDSYPGRDDVVAYLTDYARDFELPVELSSRVRAVRQGERGYLVELDDRSYEADQVVIATDGYTGGLLPGLDAVVQPTRGQVVVTEPLERRLFPCPHYARHGYDYWQQTPDNRLVVGGLRDKALDEENTAEEQTTSLIQGHLERFVGELTGDSAEITHRWAGIFGWTRDRLPLVGRIPGHEGVWVSAGYSGHGNVMGLACGELVARAILGDTRPELELFEPARLVSA